MIAWQCYLALSDGVQLQCDLPVWQWRCLYNFTLKVKDLIFFRRWNIELFCNLMYRLLSRTREAFQILFGTMVWQFITIEKHFEKEKYILEIEQ